MEVLMAAASALSILTGGTADDGGGTQRIQEIQTETSDSSHSFVGSYTVQRHTRTFDELLETNERLVKLDTEGTEKGEETDGDDSSGDGDDDDSSVSGSDDGDSNDDNPSDSSGEDVGHEDEESGEEETEGLSEDFVYVEDDAETFVVTAYTSGPESTGKTEEDEGYGVTASGEDVEEGVTVACPPSMDFGTVVDIQGIGERVCEDRGGDITSKRLDLYMDSLEEAQDFGKKEMEVETNE